MQKVNFNHRIKETAAKTIHLRQNRPQFLGKSSNTTTKHKIASPRQQEPSCKLDTANANPPRRSRDHRQHLREDQECYLERKKRDRVGNLEDAVQRLRIETHTRSATIIICPGVSENLTPWQVVIECFRLFRNGLNTRISMPETFSSSAKSPFIETRLQHAEMFSGVWFNTG